MLRKVGRKIREYEVKRHKIKRILQFWSNFSLIMLHVNGVLLKKLNQGQKVGSCWSPGVEMWGGGDMSLPIPRAEFRPREARGTGPSVDTYTWILWQNCRTCHI